MIKTRSCTWLRRPDGILNTQSEVTGDPTCCSLHCGHVGALDTGKVQTPKSHTLVPDKAEMCLYTAAPTLARAPHSLMTPDIQSPLSSRSLHETWVSASRVSLVHRVPPVSAGLTNHLEDKIFTPMHGLSLIQSVFSSLWIVNHHLRVHTELERSRKQLSISWQRRLSPWSRRSQPAMSEKRSIWGLFKYGMYSDTYMGGGGRSPKGQREAGGAVYISLSMLT